MAMVRPYPRFPAFRMKLGVMPDFSGAKYSHQETLAGEQNGANKTFALMYQPLPESVQIVKDGMVMKIELDYTLDVSSGKVIFSSNQIPREKSVVHASYKHY